MYLNLHYFVYVAYCVPLLEGAAAYTVSPLLILVGVQTALASSSSQVRDEVSKKVNGGLPFEQFTADEFASQVVEGTNYRIKVRLINLL